ncbi:MAG TPA: hypothetical protein VNE82_16390 [Candidatus Binataceae bacterium]|nr:hypothetical protein [Candidatus Binataceae bacterium]
MIKRTTNIVVWCAIARTPAFPTQGFAQDVKSYTVQTPQQRQNRYHDAKPAFKHGDVIHQNRLNEVRPFVPPGECEQVECPGVHVELGPSVDHTAAAAYMKCTEEYQAQVRLTPDGTFANYTCGLPFPDIAILIGDANSAIKAAWNR